MTDDTDFSPAEQATWDAMKAEQPIPEPAPEPTPEPADTLPAAAAPEPAKPEPVEKEEVERIPLSVLLEERKEARERFRALERQLQQFTQPKPVETPAIDPNDHVGLLKHTAAELEAIKREREQMAELNALGQFGQAHAQEFKKQAADFDEAYNHLRMSRAQQLMEQGADPQQIAIVLRGEEADILRMCAKMGVNPASMVYALSHGAGYTKAAPAVTESPGSVNNALREAARDEKTGQFVKADPKAKVEMAAKGHAQAANPVAAAGAGQGGPIDLRALAGLDGDEFDKATDGRAWKKLWGG
jgi:hypothetical protein